MDVRYQVPFFRCVLATICLSLLSCGHNMDMDKEYGRQARIDEANRLLSEGYCQLALDTIAPVYDNTTYRTDEVIILKSASYACMGGFNFLTMADNLANTASKLAAVAKTMSASGSSDSKISNMLSAVDVITSGNTVLSAAQRTSKLNSYMVFLQLGVLGSIISAYGAPSTGTGVQTADLQYSVDGATARQPGDMENEHVCALAATFSAILDSFANSNLGSNTDIGSVTTSFNAVCSDAGAACTSISKDRTTCDGTANDTESMVAALLAAAVNSAW